MWDYLNVPLKSTEPNGYDVVMASEMLGIWTPRKSIQQVKDNLPEHIESKIFEEYQEVISKGIDEFERIGYSIPLEEINVNILLGDKDSKEMEYSIEVIKEGRNTKGFGEVSAYMFGDEVAKKQGYSPVGLSANAGYTIGYHLIKQYLVNSKKSISEATLTPTEEIIRVSKFFD
ncbi:DUF2268 domain-containing putative Zn-dependent protease [uncultured Clostridium sp.]|uniref:DUF2268 domain-containing putative Zn-dependent protease n=1 Tax=uncultured Clostridium sp. TaxID=59620 RepID=UPI0032163BC6